MPQVSSLPIDEPVGLPHASPQQFGSVGETIAGLGQETLDMALGNEQFERHLIEAQRQLKYKQIEINVGRLESQAHEALSKAVTPEEAQAVHAQFKQQVDDMLSPLASDKALAPHLHIYGQQVDVEMQNTVNARKATILQKGDEEANKVILETSSNEAINIRAAGGDWQATRSATELKLQQSVSKGLMLPQQKDAEMLAWDKHTESGFIEAQLNSPNLQTVQDTVNDMRLHPGNYPHLNKGELNALAEKGENEIVSRLSRQDEIDAKAEVNKYWNQSPTGIPKMFTDSGGNFDQDKADSYIAGLGLSPQGEKKLLEDSATHAVATSARFKKEATKNENDILKLLTDGNYGDANQKLEQVRPWLEDHGFGAMYKGILAYKNQRQRESMSEAQQARSITTFEEAQQRQIEHEQSQEQLSQIAMDTRAGKRYSDADLRAMSGVGKGKMFTSDVDAAIRMQHSFEDDPANKPFYNSIWNNTGLPPNVQGQAIAEFDQYLREHPDAKSIEKQKAVNDIVDPKNVQLINQALDKVDLSGKSQPQSNKQAPKNWTDNAAPAIGEVRKGYKFNGGDPSDKANWTKVAKP